VETGWQRKDDHDPQPTDQPKTLRISVAVWGRASGNGKTCAECRRVASTAEVHSRQPLALSTRMWVTIDCRFNIIDLSHYLNRHRVYGTQLEFAGCLVAKPPVRHQADLDLAMAGLQP